MGNGHAHMQATPANHTASKGMGHSIHMQSCSPRALGLGCSMGSTMGGVKMAKVEPWCTKGSKGYWLMLQAMLWYLDPPTGFHT